VELDDRVGLAEAERAALEALIAGHHTLAEVLRWALDHEPPRLVAEVVVQDEYTHDVVLPYRDALHLVYDTT